MWRVLREIGTFFKSVLWQWWGLMSCALWTFTAVYGQMHSKPDAWYVHASFGLAIFIVCVSTFPSLEGTVQKRGSVERMPQRVSRQNF